MQVRFQSQFWAKMVALSYLIQYGNISTGFTNEIQKP
jgi:hypothetical protein